MEHLDSVTLIPAGIVVIVVVFLVIKAFGKNTPTYVEDEGGDIDRDFTSDDLSDFDELLEPKDIPVDDFEIEACKQCSIKCKDRKADYVG